jgi:hypothetical protein
MATSIAVHGQGQGTDGTPAPTDQGLQLPEAAPGTGQLQLLAGLGHLPAVTTYLQRIMEEQERLARWA